MSNENGKMRIFRLIIKNSTLLQLMVSINHINKIVRVLKERIVVFEKLLLLSFKISTFSIVVILYVLQYVYVFPLYKHFPLSTHELS